MMNYYCIGWTAKTILCGTSTGEATVLAYESQSVTKQLHVDFFTVKRLL
jgi:hypothetical protein